MFLDNKYSKHYFSIVKNAKSRVQDFSLYYEKHHIIPKSLGGNNLKENLVKLTAREHFICHLLLTKMTIGKERGKMIFAFRMLNANNRFQFREKISNSRFYEKLKHDYSVEMSKIHSNKTPWNKGKTQTKEHNEKISKSLKGLKRTEEQNKRNSESKKGRKPSFLNRKHTEETKKKLAEYSKGPQPITECPHCGKSGGRGNMTRYHFNNCKFICLI